jgi:HlyD family secretion protein
MNEPNPPKPVSGAMLVIRQHIVIGLAVLALLVVGVGGLAAMTQLAGAVIASGLLVVDSNVKKVQHPSGGVVGEILVRDGVHVRTGDVLVRLDETITRANLAIVVKALDELAARQARLEAERDGEEAVSYPESLTSRKEDPDVARILNSEQRLFELRRAARSGQRMQLGERVTQLKEEVSGLTGQAKAKGSEIELIAKELQAVRDLWNKNLVSISRLTQLERESTRLEGERGQLTAAIAQAKGKISEVELQILQLDQDLRSEVAKELREIQARHAEYVERKVAAQDQLKRIEIRAPIDGVVHQLAVHTVGGVIQAGEALMLIVPESERLIVEVRVNPQDIDQVKIGQRALLRFAAFNQRTTPEVYGSVSQISADIVLEQRTGASFYVVRITLEEKEVSRLGAVKLVAGMPVEAFIETDRRTILSYLLKPIADHGVRAFRDR